MTDHRFVPEGAIQCKDPRFFRASDVHVCCLCRISWNTKTFPRNKLPVCDPGTRIVELEQALERAEAELSQLKERVVELPEVDGPHHYRPGSESFWIGDPRTNRFVEFDGGRCYADGKAFPIADVAWMGAALLAAAREAGK